jgi:2-haloacid dehalogenase
VSGVDFTGIDVLTFDCYGTLIDWEAGILAGLRRVLDPHGVAATDDELLEAYAREVADIEAGPYRRYREVLGEGLWRVARGHGVEATPEERSAFGGSVGDWPPFPDSAEALGRLVERFRLGVITNCDDDLFALSNRRLGVTFDWIITAEQVGAYKPDPRNFEVALERIGLPRERILHVAQSLFHDHVPARSFGLATAWIDRRRDRPGFGATPPAEAAPDLVAPDMATFVERALGTSK